MENLGCVELCREETRPVEQEWAWALALADPALAEPALPAPMEQTPPALATGEEELPRGKRNQSLGARGEEAAAHFLQRNGYFILERNWTCFAGEADIIAVDGRTLAFIEVKTRRGTRKGFPAEAVVAAKREKYEHIALAYVTDHDLGEVVVRFDVVSIVVLPGERAFIRHHLGAYSAE